MTSDIKVIVFELKVEELSSREQGTIRKSDLLLPPTLDTDGWKFSREEANEG